MCVSYPRHGKGVQNVSETRRRLLWVEFGLAVAAQAVHLSTMSGWPMQLHMLQCMAATMDMHDSLWRKPCHQLCVCAACSG